MFKPMILGIGALFVAACEAQVSDAALADAPIDDAFVPLSINWQNGPSVDYRVGIFSENGVYAVCAAAQNVRSIEDRQALNALKVTVNDQTLINGLGWARIYPGGSELDGQAAACRITDVAVVENAKFDVEMTKSSFIRNRF